MPPEPAFHRWRSWTPVVPLRTVAGATSLSQVITMTARRAPPAARLERVEDQARGTGQARVTDRALVMDRERAVDQDLKEGAASRGSAVPAGATRAGAETLHRR